MSVDPDDNGFAERLKTLMGKENFYAFASRCKISRASMKAILDKGTPLTGKNLARLKRVTGVSLDWLVAGEGVMYPVQQGGSSVMQTGEGASPPYFSARAALPPTWLAPVLTAYKRLVAPEHTRSARTAVLANRVLAADFPHLRLADDELENVLAILNKMADDLPKEVPVTIAMVRAWLRQLEEQGNAIVTGSA